MAITAFLIKLILVSSILLNKKLEHKMNSQIKISSLVSAFAMVASAIFSASLAEAQQLAKIPSNLDLTPWVVTTENMPLANYPRAWGEYPNPCTYANFRYDDPIQKPGQFSAAPLHVFFGNT